MYKKETKVDKPVSKGEVKRGTTPIHPGNVEFHWFWVCSNNSNSAEYSLLWHYEEDFFDSSINEGGGI